ncbi:hypothetical protein [Chelativorans sp. AA-79]|nr:hypothetical protein [Chelativorans sp. AA-79]WEX10301.1 hypothetical protein PVE73_04905 [Chelativorans sp. AA-79]
MRATLNYPRIAVVLFCVAVWAYLAATGEIVPAFLRGLGVMQ